MSKDQPHPSSVGSPPDEIDSMVRRYRRRASWPSRVLRAPLPLVANGKEPHLPGLEGTKLFIGGAGRNIRPGFLNVDLADVPGVDVVANVELLPFGDGSIAAIECDAVLEHVRRPHIAVAEFERVLRPGGFLHVVVPFCHPFHEYPRDYQRWTIDGLKELLSRFEIIEVGVRTGPTATLLAFVLEFVKVLTPKPLRKVAYGAVAWIIWPLRYLDLFLMRNPEAKVLANHVYALVRKSEKSG